MKILFDGKILTRKITGVERYAWEILKEIDEQIERDEFTIVIPFGYKIDGIDDFKNFKICYLKGFKKLSLWEQISLPMYAKKENGLLVSLDFVNFFLKPGISTCYDVSYLANPEFFNSTTKQRLVRLKLKIYGEISKHSKYPIFTISEFQKNEIKKFYKIKDERINVASSAWQHFELIKEDNSVFEKYDIRRGDYFFSLSSDTPNKNFKWIYETAKLNPEEEFVIVGGKTSISKGELKSLGNVHYLGYQSDEIVKSLYRYCKFFIFPSFYEGFGLPPLEAMSVGADVIVSRASSLPEIFEDSAIYVDPEVPNGNLKVISKPIHENKNHILDKYSWKQSASIWIEVLRKKGGGD